MKCSRLVSLCEATVLVLLLDSVYSLDSNVEVENLDCIEIHKYFLRHCSCLPRSPPLSPDAPGLDIKEINITYRRSHNFKQKDAFEFNKPPMLATDTDHPSNLSVRNLNPFRVDRSVAIDAGKSITTGNHVSNAVIKGLKGRSVCSVATVKTVAENSYTPLDNSYTSPENMFGKLDSEADNESEMTVASFEELEEYDGIEWDVDGCTTEFNRTTHRVAIQCNHMTSFAVILVTHEARLPKWSEILIQIITTVGCSLSFTTLTTSLVIYILFRSKIESYHFAIHFNLMAAILASLFVFIGLVKRTELKVVCLITKYTLQYLFLTMFFWMLCEGVHLYRKVITVFEVKTRHIFVFHVIGWGLPLILVFITIGIQSLIHNQDTQKEPDINDTYKENKNPICFLSYEDSSVWYFAVPAITIITINAYILLRITIAVFKAAKIQTQASAKKIHQAKTGIRSALLMMPLLGFTYVVGLAASIDPIFEVLFDMLNSLQGFFIAFFYCGLNSEITAAVRKSLHRSPKTLHDV